MAIYNKIIIFILVLLISIIAHEFGHWIHIKRQTGISMQPKIKLDYFKTRLSMKLPKGLTNEQKLNNALFGVCFGLFPIIIFILGGNWYYNAFLLPIYMAGCGSDLRLMVNIIKLENEEIFFEKKGGV